MLKYNNLYNEVFSWLLMVKLYLMRRFDMNEGFPNPSPQGIKPYIGASFVLIHENGNLVPLEERGFGNANGISLRVVKRLRTAQDRGFEIRGDVHPGYKKPINIEGDVESYQSFPAGSAEHALLLEHGVTLVYERETA